MLPYPDSARNSSRSFCNRSTASANSTLGDCASSRSSSSGPPLDNRHPEATLTGPPPHHSQMRHYSVLPDQKGHACVGYPMGPLPSYITPNVRSRHHPITSLAFASNRLWDGRFECILVTPAYTIPTRPDILGVPNPRIWRL